MLARTCDSSKRFLPGEVGNNPVNLFDPFGLSKEKPYEQYLEEMSQLFPWKTVPTVTLRFNAFIPGSLGKPLAPRRSKNPWLYEPGLWLPGPAQGEYIRTDERTFGEKGTSRIYSTVQLDLSRIGQGSSVLYKEVEADTSIRILDTSESPGMDPPAALGGGRYWRNADRAEVTSTVSENTHGGTQTSVSIEANGIYPFDAVMNKLPGGAIPDIWFGVEWRVTNLGYNESTKSTQYQIEIAGKHNRFPAYEALVNGKKTYTNMPVDSGPSLWNLNTHRDIKADPIIIDVK